MGVGAVIGPLWSLSRETRPDEGRSRAPPASGSTAADASEGAASSGSAVRRSRRRSARMRDGAGARSPLPASASTVPTRSAPLTPRSPGRAGGRRRYRPESGRAPASEARDSLTSPSSSDRSRWARSPIRPLRGARGRTASVSSIDRAATRRRGRLEVPGRSADPGAATRGRGSKDRGGRGDGTARDGGSGLRTRGATGSGSSSSSWSTVRSGLGRRTRVSFDRDPLAGSRRRRRSPPGPVLVASVDVAARTGRAAVPSSSERGRSGRGRRATDSAPAARRSW